MLDLHFFFFKVSASWKLLTQNGKHGMVASLWWWIPSDLFFPSLSMVAFSICYFLFSGSDHYKVKALWVGGFEKMACILNLHTLSSSHAEQKTKTETKNSRWSAQWQLRDKATQIRQSKQLQSARSWRSLSIRRRLIYTLRSAHCLFFLPFLSSCKQLKIFKMKFTL